MANQYTHTHTHTTYTVSIGHPSWTGSNLWVCSFQHPRQKSSTTALPLLARPHWCWGALWSPHQSEAGKRNTTFHHHLQTAAEEVDQKSWPVVWGLRKVNKELGDCDSYQVHCNIMYGHSQRCAACGVCIRAIYSGSILLYNVYTRLEICIYLAGSMDSVWLYTCPRFEVSFMTGSTAWHCVCV